MWSLSSPDIVSSSFSDDSVIRNNYYHNISLETVPEQRREDNANEDDNTEIVSEINDECVNCSLLSVFYVSDYNAGFAAFTDPFIVKVLEGEFSLITCIIKEISPGQIIISDTLSYEEKITNPKRVHILPVQCFSLKKAQRLTEHLPLNFNLSSTMLKAISGLSYFLGGRFRCSKVEQLTLSLILHLDDPESFYLFESKSDMIWKNKLNHEYSCLFSLLNHCVSKSGSATLGRWLRYPSADRFVINSRLNAIEGLMDQSKQPLIRAFRKILANIYPMNQLFLRMHDGQTSASDMRLLRRTLLSLTELIELSSNTPNDIHVCNYFREHDSLSVLKNAIELINNTVDFQDKTGKLSVLSGFDAHLDKIKRTYSNFPEILTLAAEAEISDGTCSQCRVAFVPQIGFVIEIPNEIEPVNVELMFVSDQFKYYKSKRMHKLDELLGDIHNEIADRELAIMHTLQENLLTLSPVISELIKHAGTLDAILSLTFVSRNKAFVKPVIGHADFEICDGWNPLHDRSTIVPNDFKCTSGVPFILTGQSTSGKSMFLTQIALITVLSHIGCFVPAKKAYVPLLKHIFSNMKPTEKRGFSSYFSDLNKMSSALKMACGRSLVLIDDFGKGTTKSSAQSLLISAIDYWMTRKETPFLLIATNSSLNYCSQPVVHMMMENVDGINTYRLCSYAPENYCTDSIDICRKNCLLPVPVVLRAKQLLHAVHSDSTPLSDLVYDDSKLYSEFALRCYDVLNENQACSPEK